MAHQAPGKRTLDALRSRLKPCSAGYSALFTTLTHLAEALDTASYPGLVRQRLRRYTTPSVLIIDEVGYTKLSPGQAHHFFELVTARYEHGSILLDFQYQLFCLGELLGDEVLATALLDRLLHHAEVIAINGRSYRMKDRREAGQAGKGKMSKGGSMLDWRIRHWRWGQNTVGASPLAFLIQ